MSNIDKEQKIWIIVTITTVTILIFLFAGITYAYFTANDNNGSTAQIITDSGKMTITYQDGGNNLLVSSNISPSNNIIANKTFTLTGLNTTTADGSLSMPYNVGIKYTSSFSDGQIHYYIKEVNRANTSNVTVNYTGETNQIVQGNPTYTGYSHGTLKNGNRYTELVTGEFPASTNNQTITFNLLMQFPDTGENQDTEKGKNINAKVIINYDPKVMVDAISKLYEAKSKDEKGITPDGLQKDGTGDFNISLLSNTSTQNYKASLLNNIIADTENDEYDNLRYVGSTPNNYILFNNEIWRIIGIFNVYNTETNKYEKLTKIIRDKSLGKYSWDTSDSSINEGYGIDEWSQADLMIELNTDYIDTSKTSGSIYWYSGFNNIKSMTYDYSKNIKSGYIDKIANVRWNLGGVSLISYSANKFYESERGTHHMSNPSDEVTRTDYWDGKIGLIYPSDYGYASTDEYCRNDLTKIECANQNWLYYSNMYYTLSSLSYSEYNVFYIYSTGPVGFGAPAANRGVRPSLYLKSATKIISGTGTSTNPFIID